MKRISFLRCPIHQSLEQRVKSLIRLRHTMRQIAATCRCDKSPRLHCCCDKSLGLILSLRYVARIQTSLNSCDKWQRQKFCHGDNKFYMSHDAICCSNQPWRRVAAICRIVCLGHKQQGTLPSFQTISLNCD